MYASLFASASPARASAPSRTQRSAACSGRPSASSQQQTVPEAAAEVPQSKSDRVHEIDDDSQHELMAALWSKYGSAKAAFDSFSNDGTIGKKEMRQMVKKTLPTMLKAQAKALQKMQAAEALHVGPR